jgi:hypothetical protein
VPAGLCNPHNPPLDCEKKLCFYCVKSASSSLVVRIAFRLSGCDDVKVREQCLCLRACTLARYDPALSSFIMTCKL